MNQDGISIRNLSDTLLGYNGIVLLLIKYEKVEVSHNYGNQNGLKLMNSAKEQKLQSHFATQKDPNLDLYQSNTYGHAPQRMETLESGIDTENLYDVIGVYFSYPIKQG